MGLSAAAIEEKFQRLEAGTGIDLQTDEEREAAEKDAAEAQKELEAQQAKEAKEAELEAMTDEEKAKASQTSSQTKVSAK